MLLVMHVMMLLPEQLAHEADVRYRQAQRLDSRQPLFVRERRDFSPQLVESFVQVEHSAAFANVGGAPLGDGGDATAGFLVRVL